MGKETLSIFKNWRFWIHPFSLFLGVVIAFRLVPETVRQGTFQRSRYLAIYEGLHSKKNVLPQAVIFGNSTAMVLDASQLRDEIPGRPVIWNLATTGQSLLEAFLLYEALPESVKEVTWCITSQKLEDELALHHQKYAVARLLGFEFSSAALKALKPTLPSQTIGHIYTPLWKLRIESRSTFISAVNDWVTQLARKDLDLEKSINDLFHPSPYSIKVDESVLRYQLKRHYVPEQKYRVNIDALNVIKTLHQLTRKDGINLTVVLMPINPKVLALMATDFEGNLLAAIRELRKEGINVMELHKLVESENFIDHIHVDEFGAALIVKRLAKMWSDTN